jgi:hypothetical protein
MKSRSDFIVLGIIIFVLASISVPIISVLSNGDRLDEKTLVPKIDSVMNDYLKKIQLNNIENVGSIPSGKYFIWYSGPGTKYFAEGKSEDAPIIGPFGGSYGDRNGLNQMNKFYRKLKKQKIEYVFLIKALDPDLENFNYNKQRITKTTPWGSTLDSRDVDVIIPGSRISINLAAYLVDLKSLKAIAVCGLTCSKESNGDHGISQIGSDNKLSSKQIWYLIDKIGDDFYD